MSTERPLFVIALGGEVVEGKGSKKPIVDEITENYKLRYGTVDYRG